MEMWESFLLSLPHSLQPITNLHKSAYYKYLYLHWLILVHGTIISFLNYWITSWLFHFSSDIQSDLYKYKSDNAMTY